MDKLKKSLSFVLLSLVAFTGILFGCAGKYDNMKLISSVDGEEEIVLYVPQAGEQGEIAESSVTITYSVVGVGNNVSHDIILPASDEYIDVSDPQKDGDKTVVTVTAKKGRIDTYNFVALTKEGGVTNTVKIRCEKRITEMSLTGKEYAITNKVGQTLQLAVAELLTFLPQDATQKAVVFSTTESGVTLTENGLLTIDERLTVSEIPVTITSKFNSGLSVQTFVKVITELEQDDVSIKTTRDDVVAEDDTISLMSNVAENSIKHLKVQIGRTDLRFSVNFSVDGTNIAKIDGLSSVIAYSDDGMSNAEATLSAYDLTSDGTCKLYVSISLTDYLGIEPLVVERNIVVSKIAKKLQVTANNVQYRSDFELELSTNYGNDQNGLPLIIDFADNPKNVQYFVAVQGELVVVDRVSNPIVFAEYVDNDIYENLENVSILDAGAGQPIYVRGLSGEPAKLVIYAYGSKDGSRYLTKLIVDCKTYIAAQSLEVKTTKVFDEEGEQLDYEKYQNMKNTIFVEVGKSVVLTNNEDFGYVTDGGSAKNLKLELQSISSSLARYIEITYQNAESDNPQITITGKVANLENQYIYAQLVLPNFVKGISKIDENTQVDFFRIFVFESVTTTIVNFDDPQSVVKVFENGDHVYSGVEQSLSYMAIKFKDRTAHVDLQVLTKGANSEQVMPYDISYLPTEQTGKLYFGSGTNKSKLYVTDISEDENVEIEINVETLSTSDDGKIVLKNIKINDINVRIIKNLDENSILLNFLVDGETTKASQTLYWADKLPNNQDDYAKLCVNLIIDSAFVDNVALINETKYLMLGATEYDAENKIMSFYVEAKYENYGLMPGAVEYDDLPQVLNCKFGVQVSYFGQIVTKYLTVELKKPVLPGYLRLDDLSSEKLYTIEINGTSGYIIDVTNLDADCIRLYAKLYAQDGSDTVTDKNVVWKNKDDANVTYESYLDNYGLGYSVCEIYTEDIKKANNKLVLTVFAEHNVGLTKEIVIYLKDGQSEGSAVVIDSVDTFKEAMANQSGTYYAFDANIDSLEIDAIDLLPSNFAGHIDGKGKTVVIKNLNSYLIEKIESSASISNLNIELQAEDGETIYINADQTFYFSAIAKENFGTISNVTVTFKNPVHLSCSNGTIYFGGIVNSNFGVIENSSVFANEGILIESQSNVGGIVSVNGSSSDKKGELDKVKFEGNIVVSKMDGNNGDNYLLGGIAGSNSGLISNAQTLVKDHIKGYKNVGGVAGKVENGDVEGSFVRASAFDENGEQHYYNNGHATIEGYTNVGGLVAISQGSKIEKCFAKVEVISDEQEGIAGGLFAQLDSTRVQYAYVIGSVVGRTWAQIAGSAGNVTFIIQAYAIMNEDVVDDRSFVAGELEFVLIENCARLVVGSQQADGISIFTSEQLKDIETFENNLGWDIGQNSSIWRIDNTRNDGYPVLVYKNLILDDAVVNTFDVKLENGESATKIKLPLGSNCAITDLLSFEINGYALENVSFDRIYVSASENCGNITTAKQILSSSMRVSSDYSSVVKIIFECRDDITKKQEVVIEFAKTFGDVVGNVTLKKGVSQNVEFVYQNGNKIVVANGFGNDMFVAVKKEDINIGELEEDGTIYNVIQTQNGDDSINNLSKIFGDIFDVTIDGVDYYLFNDHMTLASLISEVEHLQYNFDLYQKIGDYYIKINAETAILKLNFVGETATQLLVDTESILVTPSSSQTVEVLVYVKSDKKPTVECNMYFSSEFVIPFESASYVDISEVDFEKLVNSTVVYAWRFVYKVEINEEFLNGFSKITHTVIENIKISGEISFKVDEQEKLVMFTASLQNVNMLDAIPYPIEKDINSAYVSGSPQPNLSAGEMALLDINIAPHVGTYNRIEVTSSVTDLGVKFGFIQLVKNQNKYLEAKPNAISVQNGVKLYRISELDGQNDVWFNGHFYIACVLNGTLKTETSFLITVKVYLSQNDTAPITKTVELKVLPTPDVSLTFAEVQSTGQTDEHKLTLAPFMSSEQQLASYYMLARGLSVDLKQILSFTPTSNTVATIEVRGTDNEIKDASDYVRLAYLGNNNWRLTALQNEGVKQGTVIAVRLSAEKQVVGNVLTHTYYSDWIYFYIVDFIITGIKITQPSQIIYYNQTSQVKADIQAIYDESDANSALQIEQINEKVNNDVVLDNENKYENYYWFDVDDDSKKQDKLVSYSYTVLFGPYYETDEIKYNVAGKGIYIYGTKIAKDSTTVLKVLFEYNYNANGELIFGKDVNGQSCKHFGDSISFEIKESASITSPMPIYSISDFYAMKSDVDYILMTDLTFGAKEETAEQNVTMQSYNPFDFVSNSLDGNSKTITILGDNGAGFGLFKTIGSNSIIKNLNVVYDVASDDYDTNIYTIDMKETGTVALGGFAGQNNGVITNSKVIYKANVCISAKPNSTSDISGAVAGFVSANSGKITYCSVESSSDANGIKISYNTSESYTQIDEQNSQQTTTDVAVSLNMAGFVNTNSNLVSNCQVVGVGLNNVSSEKNKKLTAGFVNTNSKNIFASSVVGVLLENDFYAEGSNTQAILKSKYQIAGFASINSGTIRDSYANIPMSTTQSTAGFVFDNKTRGDGEILTSYTACQYVGLSTSNTHSAFFGFGTDIDNLNQILVDWKKSKVQNVYYFAEERNNNSDSSQYDPAGYLKPTDGSYKDEMLGFDLSQSQREYTEIPNSIWEIGELHLPTLAENEYNDKIHNDYQKVITNIEVNGENQKLYCYGDNEKVPGTDIPMQVASAVELLAGLKDENGNYMFNYSNIRLVNDIDFSSLGNEDILKLSKTKFEGYFDGNGMTISGINVVSNDGSSEPFGLFKQIGSDGTQTIIKNLTAKISALSSSASVAVGSIAGVALNVNAKNIYVTAQSGSGTITGKNIVGGVFGLVLGNSTLYNLNADVNVLSLYSGELKEYPVCYYSANLDKDENENEKVLSVVGEVNKLSYSEFISNLSNEGFAGKCSYAGGIAGVVDISVVNYVDRMIGQHSDYEDYDNLTTGKSQPNISSVTVSGDITISGAKAGGIFGYIGKNTLLSNANFVVSDSSSQKIVARSMAGGLVAENFAGIIMQSKVSTPSEDAYLSDQNLTNSIGETLFADCENPEYIGGLIGYSYGGAVIHSYSKTNVINNGAKFVGGLIGGAKSQKIQFETSRKDDAIIYDTSFDNDMEITRPVCLKEVYTTANVFAGVDYVISTNAGDDFETATPKYYAGGIFGKIMATDAQDFVFDGVVGANGFHRPASYDLPVQVDINKKATTYGQIASGYYFESQNTAGASIKIKYGATLGAFVGKLANANIEQNELQLDYKTQSGNSALRPNLFVEFAYNNVDIKLQDAQKENGKPLELCAVSPNCSLEFKQSYQLDQFEVELNVDDVSAVFSLNGQGVRSSYKFGRQYTYFVIRGDKDKYVELFNENENIKQTKYFNSFAQNSSGVYKNWEKWLYQQPIYPDFMKNDLDYIEIKNEGDLLAMQVGKRYKLVADIYLTGIWTPKNLYNVTLISGEREAGDPGIDRSKYYSIYNINIDSDNNNSVGFFGIAENCIISNINFVFGTKYANDQLEQKVSATNVSNFGLLVGESISSTIAGCSVYVNLESINVNAKNDQNANIGGLIGSAKITQLSANKLKFVKSPNTVNVKDENGEDTGKVKWISTEGKENHDAQIVVNRSGDSDLHIVNIGGVVGYIDSLSSLLFADLNDIWYNKLSANIQGAKNTLNIGGIVGQAKAASIGVTMNQESEFNGHAIEIAENNIYASNIGGFAGKIEDASTIENLKLESISIESQLELSGEEINDQKGQISVGGFAGYVCSNEGKKGKITISNVQVSNVKFGIENSNNTGGFAGLAEIKHALGIAIENCQVSDWTSMTKAGVTKSIKGQYVGGFVGKFDGNASNYIDLRENSVDWESNLTLSISDIPANAGDEALSSAGGFVGCFKAINGRFDRCYVKGFDGEFEQNDSSSGANFAYLGGFAGQILAVNQMTDCYASQFELTSGKGTKRFAGFVAELKGNCKIKNCYSQGLMHVTRQVVEYAGGFGAHLALIDSHNRIQLTNCLSDVNIEYSISGGMRSIAGFVAYADNCQIKDCVSIGKIQQKTVDNYLTDERIYGFVADSNNKIDDSNFALSTMWLLGDNVGATTPYANDKVNANDKVKYSYNVSGAFNQTNGTRMKYADILHDLSEKIEDKTDLVSIYLNGLFGKESGSNILNPKQFASTVENDKYYIVNSGNYTFNITENKAFIIANDDAQAPTINVFQAFANSGYIAGVELCAKGTLGAIISQNSGYIFNCVGTGVVKANDDNTAGFVQTNSGYVNACGSMAHIMANKETEGIVNVYDASGFVSQNSKIIANSWATNTIYGANSQKSYYGFVKSNTGNIHNSFAGIAIELTPGENFVENVYGFASGNTGLVNCYYDAELDFQTLDNMDNNTACTYEQLRKNKNSNNKTILNGFNTNEDNSYQINFGYAYSTSFNKTSNLAEMSESQATYRTIATEQDKIRYIIHSIDQLASIVSNSSNQSNVYTKMICSINAQNGSSEDYNLNIGDKTFDLTNDKEHGIYNVNIKNDHGSVGLFNTGSNGTVTLKNLAVSGKWKDVAYVQDNTVINGIDKYFKVSGQNVGVVVGNASNLNAENVNAFLIPADGDTTSYKFESNPSFGIFAGNVGNAELKSCGVGIQNQGNSSNIEILGALNAGTFVGKASSLTIEDSQNKPFVVDLGQGGKLSATNVGGVVGSVQSLTIGKNQDTLTFEMLSGTLSGTTVGGIVGYINEGDNGITLNASVIDATVNLTGTTVGGIVGKITSDFASNKTINISGEMSGEIIGGIAGEMSCDLNNITISTDLYIKKKYDENSVGGIIGTMTSGTINNCTYSGKIISDKDCANEIVGGIVGTMTGGTIQDIKINGAVSLNGQTVGGIVGKMTGGLISVTSTQNVLGNHISLVGLNAGGIVGEMLGGTVSGWQITGEVKISSNPQDIESNSGSGTQSASLSSAPRALGLIVPGISGGVSYHGSGGTSTPTPKSYSGNANFGGIAGKVGVETEQQEIQPQTTAEIYNCKLSGGLEVYYPLISNPKSLIDSDDGPKQLNNIGSIAGIATNATINGGNKGVSSLTVKKAKVESLSSDIYANLNVGGIVGKTTNSVVQNYIAGTLTANELPSGDRKSGTYYCSQNNIGGIVGDAVDGSEIKNVKVTGSLACTATENYVIAYVGGIAGRLAETRANTDTLILTVQNSARITGTNEVSGGMTYTFNGLAGENGNTSDNDDNTAYVGGLVGYSNTLGKIHGTSFASVIGTSSAKKQADGQTTTVYDAKTYYGGETDSAPDYCGFNGVFNAYINKSSAPIVGGPATGSYCYGYYNIGNAVLWDSPGNIVQWGARAMNYIEKEVSIPLAVGGLFGYYEKGTILDENNDELVKKLSGEVTATLTYNDLNDMVLKTQLQLSDTKAYDKVYYEKSGDWSGHGGNNSQKYDKDDTDIFNNKEKVQCRAGSFAGIAKENHNTIKGIGSYTAQNIIYKDTLKRNEYQGWDQKAFRFVTYMIHNEGTQYNGHYIPSYASRQYSPLGNLQFADYYLSIGEHWSWFEGIASHDDVYNRGIKDGTSIANYDSNGSHSIVGRFNNEERNNYVFSGFKYNNTIYNKSFWAVLGNNGEGGLYSDAHLYAIGDWAGEQIGGVVADETGSAPVNVTYDLNTDTNNSNDDGKRTMQYYKSQGEIITVKLVKFSDLFTSEYIPQGKKFGGWKLSKTSQIIYTEDDSIEILKDKTIYAHWVNSFEYDIEIFAKDPNDETKIENIGHFKTQSLQGITRDNPLSLSWQDIVGAGSTYKSNGYKLTKIDTFNYSYTVEDGKNIPIEMIGYELGTLKISLANGIKAYMDGGKAYLIADGENGEKIGTNVGTNPSNIVGSVYEYSFCLYYEPIEYQVEFVGGAGTTGNMDNQTFVYDDETQLAENAFAKTGYTFAGWKCGNNTYADKQAVKNLATIDGTVLTFEAQWTPIEYQIEFVGGAGTTGNMDDQTFVYDDETQLAENSFAKTGYTFAGWKCGNNTYADKQAVKNLATIDGTVLTFEAQWTPNVIAVTLSPNVEIVGEGYQSQVVYLTFDDKENIYSDFDCTTAFALNDFVTDIKNMGEEDGYSLQGYFVAGSQDQYISYQNDGSEYAWVFNFDDFFTNYHSGSVVLVAHWTETLPDASEG